MRPDFRAALPRAIAALAFALVACVCAALAEPSAAEAAPLVAIDAGHGGRYSGAVGNGAYEKDLNLAVAVELQQLLSASRLQDRHDAHQRRGWSRKGTRRRGTGSLTAPHFYADGAVRRDPRRPPGARRRREPLRAPTCSSPSTTTTPDRRRRTGPRRGRRRSTRSASASRRSSRPR